MRAPRERAAAARGREGRHRLAARGARRCWRSHRAGSRRARRRAARGAARQGRERRGAARLRRAMRELARRPQLPARSAKAVDIVGTGGDGSGSLNLSTGAALLTAAAGSGRQARQPLGLEPRRQRRRARGARLPVAARRGRGGRCLAATGFTFLFAPHYHPAMKSIAPVRQALGVRTVFNILGPLTNPAAPPFHVIGAYDCATAPLIADTLAGMASSAPSSSMAPPAGTSRRRSVPSSSTTCVRAGCSATPRPEDYGLAPCALRRSHGGDAAHNRGAAATRPSRSAAGTATRCCSARRSRSRSAGWSAPAAGMRAPRGHRLRRGGGSLRSSGDSALGGGGV